MLIPYAFILFSLGSSTIGVHQDFKQIRYCKNLEVTATDKQLIQDSVIGWDIPTKDLELLPTLLSNVLNASVDLTKGGRLRIMRSKAEADQLKEGEIEALDRTLKELLKEREKIVGASRGGTTLERIVRFVADKPQYQPEISLLQELLPAGFLQAHLISRVQPHQLEELLKSERIVFSTSPLTGQSTFPFDPNDFVNDYLASQSVFAQQALSQPLQGRLGSQEISDYLPRRLVLRGRHDIWLEIARVGYGICSLLNVWDPVHHFESCSVLGGILKNEASAVTELFDRDHSATDRVKISPKNLAHYAQRADTSWDMHGLQIDKSEFGYEPASVLVNPASADPLSFEVEEAIADWAKWKGARGWIANCPDAVYKAFSRSMIKGYLDLTSFDRLLLTDGRCQIQEEQGILTIQPTRPIASHLNQVNRESLRRLVTSCSSAGNPALSEVAAFALANFECLNIDLGFLLSRAIFDTADLRSDAEGNRCDAISYALLGCIPENFRTRILDGLPTEVPSIAIDPEKIFLNGSIVGFADRPSGEDLIADRAEGLMTPVNGGAMKISAWTDGGVPVVRRVRKTPRTIDQFSNAYEGSRVVTYPVGESIDRYWVPPSKVATLKNDDPHVKATMTDADVRERYFYRYGIQRILHLRITFPNGKISPVISYYKVEPLTDKPVEFVDLPEELKSAVLAGFQ